MLDTVVCGAYCVARTVACDACRRPSLAGASRSPRWLARWSACMALGRFKGVEHPAPHVFCTKVEDQ